MNKIFKNDSLLAKNKRKGISLTALIDVVFILLLFFMLTSTFTKWKAVELNTPVSSQQNMIEIDEPEIVLLKNNGSLVFMSNGQVIQDLKHVSTTDFLSMNKEKPLVLISEAEVTVQNIVSSLESLTIYGWKDVSLGDIQSPKSTEQP